MKFSFKPLKLVISISRNRYNCGIRFRGILLHKTKPGDIGPNSYWSLIDGHYWYMGDTFPELVKNAVKEWRQDSALAY